MVVTGSSQFTRGAGMFGALVAKDSLQVGAEGDAIPGIQHGQFTLDPASLAADTVVDETVTLTGVAAGDIVLVQPPSTLEADLVISHVEVTANTLHIRLYNPTGSPIDGASRSWYYLWFDLT